MDNEKLLGIIGALFVELEVKRGELKKSKEDEKQAVDNSEFWMDRSKEKDIEIKKLKEENTVLEEKIFCWETVVGKCGASKEAE